MRPQVAGERVPPAAGVVAEVAFEGLLPRVQLDVSQQVALLGEGGPALVALEGTLTWRETGVVSETPAGRERDTDKKVVSRRVATPTGCRSDRTHGFQTKPARLLNASLVGSI